MQSLTLVGLMLLLPECTSDLTGPETVHVILGTSAHVQCRYSPSYGKNVKYWCRKASRATCPIIVQTSGSEDPVKKDRVSIEDNHSLHRFTVTMEDLTDSDIGMYSCGVQVNGGQDLVVPVNMTTATTEPDHPEQSHDSSLPISSISSLIYVSFLVLIGLKVSILLCLVFTIIWIHRRCRWTSEEVTPETTP
ncbi:CMRF35-like molecule 7 [Elgaria multicarinata webbii]|uniref:CMRF35-like molecule 7 n=1 Tax=Elgaria multicarinata webbii TaxID=159646 RepID=UPI002FCCF9A3